MQQTEIIVLILLSSGIVFLFIAGIIIFMLQYKRKKQLHEIEKQKLVLAYANEINQAKLEIQDNTLTQIGRELHDNIGQLLTVSKIHAHSLLKVHSNEPKMIALDDALDKTITEVKALSKSLDNSRVHNFGFHPELNNEIERLNKLQVANIQVNIDGIENLPKEKAIILYRMFQEFLSNSIKYSRCKTILISLCYKPNSLEVLMKDDGIGFDITRKFSGSGLLNLKSRADLLTAIQYRFDSKLEKGTSLSFIIPIE